MPIDPLPDLASLSLSEIAARVSTDKLPPVENWNPPHCGDSNMRIARDGRWYHEGAEIGRAELVRLFARILRREPDGRFVLVTPVEKLDIAVDDVPFVATAMKSEGEGAGRRLAFAINTGDLVVADAAHRLRFAGGPDDPRPYLEVRNDLEAVVARPVYYELAELALAEGRDPLGLWSAGTFFEMSPSRRAP